MIKYKQDIDGIEKAFFYKETYKGIDIYETPITKHCYFNKKFALTIERAKQKIDGLKVLNIL